MTPDNESNVIETEFSASWDRTEHYFVYHSAAPYGEWLKPMLDLIVSLRQQGYDRQFRAGQSLDAFVLSRSRQHGLRPEQPAVVFILNTQGGMTVEYYGGSDSREVNVDRIELTTEVEELLHRLQTHPIN